MIRVREETLPPGVRLQRAACPAGAARYGLPVSDLLIGALGVLLSTNPPAVLSNLVVTHSAVVQGMAATNGVASDELRQIMAEDDAAQEEVGKWLDASDQPADPLTAPSPTALKAKIHERFGRVRARYDDYLARNPKDARGYLALGSFLNDTGDEEGAVSNWEKSRELDPQNPAVWNNLANSYAHIGPVRKAFAAYEEALRLNPREPIYWHNFGTLTFLFRSDATNHFKTDEQGVFRRALGMYEEAIRLDPLNFGLLTDVAQTYYGIQPEPSDTVEGRRASELKLARAALGAWTNALAQATDDEDRQGVYLHMARWHLRTGEFAEARARMGAVTNEVHQAMRQRLERNLTEREASAKAGAAPPRGAGE